MDSTEQKAVAGKSSVCVIHTLAETVCDDSSFFVDVLN